MVILVDLLRVPVNIDQAAVYDRQGTVYRIALHFAEGIQLFHVHVFQAGQLFEHAAGCVVDGFVALHKAARQAPAAFFGLKAPFNEKELQLRSVESENYTIYGHQHPVFAGILGDFQGGSVFYVVTI